MTAARDLATLLTAAAAGMPRDPPAAVARCQRAVKELHLGVFFDGTRNNKYRDEHTGADTNVAKLHRLYQLVSRPEEWQESTYLVGVGTTHGEALTEGLDRVRDDAAVAPGGGLNKVATRLATSVGASAVFWASQLWDVAGQVGGLGGQARLNAAYRFVSSCCSAVPTDADITVDVFGFSRGAALARTFCNLVAQALVRRHPMARLRLLGIFDTVGSFGLAGDDSEPGQNLALPEGIEDVIHCCALHEYRAGYPLSLAAPYDEWYVGAHADVGGGYATNEDGKVNHLALIPLFDVHARAVRLGVHIDDVRPTLRGVDVVKLRGTANALGRSWSGIDIDGHPQNVRAFFERYVHVSAFEWDGIDAWNMKTFDRKRTTYTPQPRELVGSPPDFDWD